MFAAIALLALSVFATVADATIWRVPENLPTIQSALDQIAGGDTILVAVGRYDEALVAPPLDFVLIGQSAPDSLTLSGTIIDIGYLPGADSLSCLTLTQSTVVAESIFFRNSEGAHDTNRIANGGITAGNAQLTVQNCLFDSVSGCIEDGQTLVARKCTFYNLTSGAILSGGAPITVQNCTFSGRGFWQVTAGSNSELIDCIFERNDQGHFLSAYGDSILIEGCTFQDYGPYAFVPVTFSAGRGCAIRNCTFSNIEIGRAVMEIQIFCDSLDGSQLEISNVVFDGYSGGFGQGGTAMTIDCAWDQPYQNGVPTNLTNAVFRNGSVVDSWETIALEALIPVHVTASTFSDLVPDENWDCFQSSPSVSDTPTYRNCIFQSNARALTTDDQNVVDARWNWWGDSTGPYNSMMNPNGQGAEVGNGIEFIPWLTDTVTSAQEPRLIPRPFSFALSAFPNPFNSQTSIRITVPRRGVYALALYDIAGRKLRELFRDTIEHDATISFDARGLPSGLYFAKLENPLTRETLRAEKIVLLR